MTDHNNIIVNLVFHQTPMTMALTQPSVTVMCHAF